MAEQVGVGNSELVQLIKLQHPSPAIIRYSERISKNKFDATGGFNLAGGMADARHIRQLADSHNVPMPTIDLVSERCKLRLTPQAHQHMITARAQGGEEMDWTALVGGQRLAAGLAPFAGKVSTITWEAVTDGSDPPREVGRIVDSVQFVYIVSSIGDGMQRLFLPV